jgi:hypothetical protein
MLHPSHGGCAGTNHAADFEISDPRVAYVQPAQAVALTIVDLLCDDAREARRILGAYRAPMTHDAYLQHMRGLARTDRFDY